MVTDRQISGRGTPESKWMACPHLGSLAAVEPAALVPPGQRLVVCAPHPDDEILPCGGLLAMLRDREILVVAITDGEASHPDRAASLRVTRPRETATALARLGARCEVTRLGFADGGLAAAESQLTRELDAIFRPTDVILTPWRFDGHPDHEATARATIQAADAVAAAAPIQMPIWGWHWSEPNNLAMPWDRAVKVWLDDPARPAKWAAIQSFESQLTARNGDRPILPKSVLHRFDRPWEVYFR